MLSLETRRAVAELAKAVQDVGPLAHALVPPLHVAPADRRGLQQVLDRVTKRLRVPSMRLTNRKNLTPFDRVVSARLALERLAGPLTASAVDEDTDAFDATVDSALALDFDSFCERATVHAADGTVLPGYAAGDPGARGVVLASACGMPARLAEVWMRRLAVHHRVVTWESRGLFADTDMDTGAGYGATDVTTQVGDLFSVMDHFGLREAHVIGLCGGAVLAVRAAGAQPERVTSLSLWHGDFELGEHAPKTSHQRNLQAFMAMAAENRVSASSVHAVLRQSMLGAVPPDLAHLVLYPYATPELLFRYCQLNGALMGADVASQLPRVTQPALVVTSEDDDTAHPDGSRYVAAALPDARLVVADSGDHLALFRSGNSMLDLAARFITQGEP
ncbi:alpha/beta fold hydrolase [Streptomyces tendae]|uniref:alpha/beta fold hydrolase n=1 Tax=Streptomyces tendae TaxID=1932 RepID=UPI0036891FD7